MPDPKDLLQVDPETGEHFDLFSDGRHGIKIVRKLSPDAQASSTIAQLDALAFSLAPPDGQSALWVLGEMQRFLPVEGLKQGRGCFGFKHSILFGDGAGLVAWGGKSQRGRVYFSIQGKGCAQVTDWQGLGDWLASRNATLKRVDVAHDDFAGATVSVKWAVAQYEVGGFNAGGRKPRHSVIGDWLGTEGSKAGCTVNVGHRSNGKLCRVYEKGKQLGDPLSPWTRVEVEWRSKDRVIPLDILTRPGSYLAGAYPCLAILTAEQSRIRTLSHAAPISFEKAVATARLQTGRLVNLMLKVFGGDFVQVVNELKRDGLPARLATYSYAIDHAPELLDPEAPGSFQAMRASGRDA